MYKRAEQSPHFYDRSNDPRGSGDSREGATSFMPRPKAQVRALFEQPSSFLFRRKLETELNEMDTVRDLPFNLMNQEGVDSSDEEGEQQQREGEQQQQEGESLEHT